MQQIYSCYVNINNLVDQINNKGPFINYVRAPEGEAG